MILNFKVYLERWRSSKNRKHDLDVLIERAQPKATLYQRLLWLVDLIQWIRFQAVVKDHAEIQNVSVPAARIRFFLQLLERNPQWKLRVAQTLRSITRDISVVDLFCEVGLPREDGFWAEFKSRVLLKLLPERPLQEGIAPLFNALFPDEEDVNWLSSLDPQLFGKVLTLFYHEVSDTEAGWDRIKIDIQDAMMILAVDLESIGLSSHLRSRMTFKFVQELPFVNLQSWVQKVIEVANLNDAETRKQTALAMQKVTRECAQYFDQVFRHLDQHGINQNVVFLLESGHAKLRRLDDLVSFVLFESSDTEAVLFFLVQLIRENQTRQSLKELFEQNTRLIARKIVDRSAEVGEHYITRDSDEYKRIFRRAAGGGWLTAFTVYLKFAVSWFGFSQFFTGLFYSINYSLSFMLIQLFGFTLATKQPAMTGPALASKMQQIENENSLEKLIDEIVYLVRTQAVCILGNVGVVVPTVIVFELLGYGLLGRHIVTPEKAQKILESTNILGPTIIFAAFTGVLLWLSSLIAGWFDNWFVLNHMRASLTFNRTLNFIFGEERCRTFANFLEKNISGFAGNISLGFLLGLTPEVMHFFGLNLDVRHVTLASGSLAAAMSQFGFGVFQNIEFWLAAIGIVFIGIFNVGVSFTLAFLVALRSRNIKAPQRRLIYSAIWTRFRQSPMQFLKP